MPKQSCDNNFRSSNRAPLVKGGLSPPIHLAAILAGHAKQSDTPRLHGRHATGRVLPPGYGAIVHWLGATPSHFCARFCITERRLIQRTERSKLGIRICTPNSGQDGGSVWGVTAVWVPATGRQTPLSSATMHVGLISLSLVQNKEKSLRSPGPKSSFARRCLRQIATTFNCHPEPRLGRSRCRICFCLLLSCC